MKESENEVAQSCPTLQPRGLQPSRLLCPWDFPGKSTGVGSHILLHGIFPTQGLNPGLPSCKQMLYRLSHQGNAKVKVSKAGNIPFLNRKHKIKTAQFSTSPRKKTRVWCEQSNGHTFQSISGQLSPWSMYMRTALTMPLYIHGILPYMLFYVMLFKRNTCCRWFTQSTYIVLGWIMFSVISLRCTIVYLTKTADDHFGCSHSFYYKSVNDENPLIYIFSQLSNIFLEQNSRKGISTWNGMLMLNFTVNIVKLPSINLTWFILPPTVMW